MLVTWLVVMQDHGTEAKKSGKDGGSGVFCLFLFPLKTMNLSITSKFNLDDSKDLL
jgi:hypothetical protein